MDQCLIPAKTTAREDVLAHRIESREEAFTPYRLPFPVDALPEIVLENIAGDDERMWVPQTEHVSMRPLCLSVSGGYWVNLLRVRRSGILTRHRHPGPVHAFVLKGRWRYLEHSWVAEEGSYAFEAPGETHTLIVPEDVAEMITLFHVTGALIYCDPDGRQTGYDDVFTKIDMCRRHFESIGLGGDYVKQFIR